MVTSESTGGYGIHYEERVDVLFLLSFLTNGYCPIVNEKITELNFHSTDYKTDDLVVYASGLEDTKKLLCQMKHTVTVSDKNEDFVKTIIDAWKDFKSPDFNLKKDRIVLICSNIAVQSKISMVRLHSKTLNALKSGVQFSTMLRNRKQFSKQDSKIVDIIKNIINDNFEEKVNDEMLFDFFRSFTILQIDVDEIESSLHYSLATSLITLNSSYDAENVWDSLYSYVSTLNQNGGYLTKEHIPSQICNLFDKNKQFNISIFEPVQEIDNFIITLAFLGGWNDINEYDQKVIQQLYGDDYSKFRNKAKGFAAKYSNLITIFDNKWHLNGKDEILEQCKTFLFDEEIEKAISCTKDVLKKDLINSERKWKVTKALRKNLVSSLCWMKLNLEALPNCNHEHIEKKLDELVYSLLSEPTSILLASLSDCIEDIAQLSPNCFMKCIENVLIRHRQILEDLFQGNINNTVPEGYISYYISAIKTLAWDPEYTVHAISLLGQLDYLSPDKSNWFNTPSHSIYIILVPWGVQTFAGSEINALISLKKDVPEVFWKVIRKLMPTCMEGIAVMEKPKYLSISKNEIHNPTNKEINELYQKYIHLAVEYAKDDQKELCFIASNITDMDANTFSLYLQYLERVEMQLDQKTKDKLWCDLYDQIGKIENNSDFDSEVKEKYKKLIERLDTNNILVKYSRLYSWQSYATSEDKDSIESKRRNAVECIYRESGIKSVIRFAEIVHFPTDVLYKLGECISIDNLSLMIDEYCKKNISFEFLNMCFNGFFKKHSLCELLHTNLPSKDRIVQLDILCNLPFSKPLYEVAEKLNIEDEYCKNCHVFCFYGKYEFEDLLFAVDHLEKYGRNKVALNRAGTSACYQYFSIDRIIKMLDSAINSNENSKIDKYAACKLLEFVHEQNDISLNEKARLDLLYLEYFDEDTYNIKPTALFTRIVMEPEYFCILLNCIYGNRKDCTEEITEASLIYIANLFFDFKCVPGTDENGLFHEKQFNSWMNYVKKWSNENDLFRIAMHTVGNGFFYALKDEDNLPNEVILNELNAFANDLLREAYKTALFNHIGAISITPDGKEALEVARGFETSSLAAEKKGFFRVSTLYRELADQFKAEAKTDYKRFVSRLND